MRSLTHSMRLTLVTLFVVVLHLLALNFTNTTPQELKKKNPIQHLVAKTVKLSPKKLIAAAEKPPETVAAPSIIETPPAPQIAEPPAVIPQKEEPVKAKEPPPPEPLPEKKPTPKPQPPKREPRKPEPKPQPPKKEVAKPQPPKKEPVKPKPKPAPAKQPPPKQKAQPSKAVPPPRPTPVKKEAPTPPPPPPGPTPEEILAKETEQKERARRAALVQQAQEAMGRMSKNVQALPPSSKETSTSKLTAIGPLATEIHIEAASGSTAAEKSYLSELIKRLKLTLKLPEVGVVYLTITIKKSGEIAHFEVEKGSKGNSDYLKATLPQIKLPPFGHHFEGSSEHTFSFSLSSEL